LIAQKRKKELLEQFFFFVLNGFSKHIELGKCRKIGEKEFNMKVERGKNPCLCQLVELLPNLDFQISSKEIIYT